MGNRVRWIDVLKGIGIFIVVLGHTAVSKKLFIWIYSFHMPMFFMISGFLYDKERNAGFKKFAISRARSILFPWLFFSLISIIFSLGRNILQPGSSDLKILIINFLTGKGVESNLPLWFLKILFIVEIVFHLVMKIEKKTYIAGILFGVFIVRLVFAFPFQVERTLLSFVFYGIGWLLRDRYLECKNAASENRGVQFLIARGGIIVLFLVWLIVVDVLAVTQKSLNIGYTGTGESILLCMTSIMGTVCMAVIAKRLESSDFLCYLGKNSIIILGTHILVMDVISVIGKVLLHLDSEWIHQQDSLRALILSIMIVLIEVPLIWIINKWFPFLIGRCKNKIV